MAVELLARRVPVKMARRWGLMVAVGLGLRLLLEQPWQHPVVWDSGSEMSVVRAAELTGVASALALALAALGLERWWWWRQAGHATDLPRPDDER
jgi:protein-S-isoprenylcysteine O-methyltransferase Ste14